ncbi:ABC transporter substrate-binding protein [Microbacterium indicum]|uniref:ABC transporter substrate-binding protein n=1 Tax=Microbacterium indicum TaxID=358100 RepID=UPI0004064E7D|nr:ABC transporter substrate-binding protein [Microbacterium indicum]
MKIRATAAVAGAAVLALGLAGCGSSDPLASDSSATPAADGTIVVGSQAYYSNEIIAEIYAQALEGAGFDVDRQFNIGQRDAYMPSIESGEITLFPEYTGNLLQYYSPDTTATSSDDVYAELQDALPDGITALEQASATDGDSYTVTADYAEQNSLTSIADLANVDGTVTLGGPAELEERPYGPEGAKSVYGLDLAFSATGDTTVDELVAGSIQVGNVFTADPRIQTDDLVTLEDPKGLILASNVVPIVAADEADEIGEVIDPISEALTPEGLVAMNVQSTEDEMSAADIATQWLSDNGLS